MANKVQLKKSSVAARVPLTTDVDYGELALNYADGKLYYKKSDGTTIDHFPSVAYVPLLSGSYANPSWITSIDASKLTGTIDNARLNGSTYTINITGNAGSISGYNNPSTLPTANTIAYRDAAGDIAAREIVLSSGLSAQTPTVLVSMYPTTNQLVRTTPAAVSSAIQTAASGTWGISVTGNSATASTLQTPRTINGTSFNGGSNINVTEWVHSDRNFSNGTLITTDINYAVTNGDPFVLEIRGNSYGNIIPLDLLYQGYIYADTIINHGGLSNGLNISGLVAINNGGNLCFWFPHQGYWQGYNVKVYVPYATRAVNRVTSITDVVKPTTAKQVDLSANIRQSLHSGNYTSYAQSTLVSGTNIKTVNGISLLGSGDLTVSASTATYAANSSKLYSTDSTYAYGSSDPYYGYLTYISANNRWRFQVSPATPAAVEVAYADSAGTADQIDSWPFRNTGNNSGVNADTIESNGITYYTSGVTNFSGNSTDGALYSQAYNSNWQHQIAGDYRSGQIAVRGKNNGTWQAWRAVLDSSNYSGYAMPLNGGINANFDIASNTNASDYTAAAIELRELNHGAAQGAAGGFQAIAPRLSFHWGGVVASQIALQSDGAICIINNPGTGYEKLRAGAITSSGNVTAYSDESLKTDWNNLGTNFVEQLATIKSGTYTRIDTSERQAGNSAQDWQKLLPEVVSTNSEGILSLAYGNAALVSSVELAKRVVEQDKRIAELERLVSKLIGD